MTKKIINIILLSVLLANFHVAFAQGPTSTQISSEYTLLEPLPCVSIGTNTSCTPGTIQQKIDFEHYMQYVFNFLIALASATAVFMIVWGGLQLMSSDAWYDRTEGKNKIVNALLGLVLILCSYIILRTIDPRLVQIPTTLVEPLGISVPNQRTSFLSSLDSQTLALLKENKDLMLQNSQIDSATKNLLSERDAKKEELEYAKSIGDEESVNLIESEIAKLDGQIANNQALVLYNTGRGVMNARIETCQTFSNTTTGIFYHNSYDLNGCLLDIQNYQRKYYEALKDYNPQMADLFNDYAKFASAASQINIEVLKNTSENPYTTAALNTLKTSVTIVSTAAGAYAGAGIGAGVGFGASLVVNTIIEAHQQEFKSTKAWETARTIQTMANNAAISINDVETKNLLITHANNLINALKK